MSGGARYHYYILAAHVALVQVRVFVFDAAVCLVFTRVCDVVCVYVPRHVRVYRVSCAEFLLASGNTE